ncbi:hypothetical protein [Sulfobacillus thermosulfidooxidans]|uniref:hypothetical protein n=1 Tax=Sulfobacillus thermosulfidooxidans TaxID=28034 RepID=UPI0006B680B2|nr:hypothetical protein [Sulfobacillus thermosulfidooxidans]
MSTRICTADTVSEAALTRLRTFFRQIVGRPRHSSLVRVTVDDIRRATHLSRIVVQRGLRQLEREGWLTIVGPTSWHRMSSYVWLDRPDDQAPVVLSRAEWDALVRRCQGFEAPPRSDPRKSRDVPPSSPR